MDNLTPNTIFLALITASSLVAVYFLAKVHIKRAYEAALKPVYREFKDD